MRLITLALTVTVGLPAMVVCQQPEKIPGPRHQIDEKKPWKGKLIFPKRAVIRITDGPAENAATIGTLRDVGEGYVVLDQQANKIQIKTWYEVDGWLDIADLDVPAEEFAHDPIHFYTAKIRANPNEPDFYRYRGVAWRVKKENDIAIMDFSESLRLRPNQSDVHFQRGIAWRRQGNHDRAANDLDAAIVLNRMFAEAYFHRAHAMREKWEVNAVRELQKRSQDLKKKWQETTSSITATPEMKQNAKKNYDEAAKDLDEARTQLAGDRKNYDKLLRGVEELVINWKNTITSIAATDEEKLKAKKDFAEAQAELTGARQDYEEALRHEPNAVDAVVFYRALVRRQLAKLK